MARNNFCWQTVDPSGNTPAVDMLKKKSWFWRIFLAAVCLATAAPLFASEADIIIPDLSQVRFDALGGISGVTLMYLGIVICLIGAAFGLVQYTQTKNLPVHE